MASTVRIEHISEGWRQILGSAGVKALVDAEGQRMAGAAGEGYVYQPAYLSYGGGRVGGYVVADTYQAKLDEAMNKTLERVANG